MPSSVKIGLLICQAGGCTSAQGYKHGEQLPHYIVRDHEKGVFQKIWQLIVQVYSQRVLSRSSVIGSTKMWA